MSRGQHLNKLPQLKQLSQHLVEDGVQAREQLSSEQLQQLMDNLSQQLEYDVKLESARALRNAVAGVPANAQLVLDHFALCEHKQDLTDALMKYEDEGLIVRVFLQTLSNSLNQNLIIKAELRGVLMKLCTDVLNAEQNIKTKNVASFILLSLMQKKINVRPEIPEDSGKTLNGNYKEFLPFLPQWMEIIEDCACDETDRSTSSPASAHQFVLGCVREVMLHTSLKTCHDQLTPHTSIASLCRLALELDLGGLLPMESIDFVVDQFTFLTDTILTTNLGSVDKLRPEEIVSLLDLIIAASQTDNQPLLQGKKSLLINVLYLLRMVHEAGNSGVADFRPIGKLSEISKLQESQPDLPLQPVYAFKAKLIRLLVNLVWEHEENKTLVGELEGVQLILDCSQMDGRNPFITQWVVMAIKALVADHPENQKVLLSLRKQGPADTTSALLKELGIQCPAINNTSNNT